MKNFLLCLFILIPFVTIGQNTNITVQNGKVRVVEYVDEDEYEKLQTTKSPAKSQNTRQEKPKPKWSITLGYSHSPTKVEIYDASVSEQMKGLYAGILCEEFFKNTRFLSTETGLLYVYETTTTEGITENMHYLNIPIHLKFSEYVAPKTKIFALAGIQTTIGIAANENSGYGISYYGDDGFMSRINLLLGAGLGVEFNRFQIRVTGHWGLLDLSTIEDIKMYQNFIQVGIGYCF